jgi:hypothetical protein
MGTKRLGGRPQFGHRNHGQIVCPTGPNVSGKKGIQAFGFEIPGKKCLFCGPAEKAEKLLNN